VNREQLRADLRKDEGTGPLKGGRLMPYWDCCGKGLRAVCSKTNGAHEGKLTIGYGRNLEDRGISFREADALLDNDIDTADANLITCWPWVQALDVARHATLTQMCFNLGTAKLAGFTNTLAAIRRGDYETGAAGMLASKWAKQVGQRASRLAAIMRTGIWAVLLLCAIPVFAQDGGEIPTARPITSLGRSIPLPVGTSESADSYHRIPLSSVKSTHWTHACVVATVTYHKREADGDQHLRLEDGGAFIVAEIIPQIPLPTPRTGTRVDVCGITRFDKHHGWAELHPVTSIKGAK